jgi:hypothetical protein
MPQTGHGQVIFTALANGFSKAVSDHEAEAIGCSKFRSNNGKMRIE